MRSESIRVFAPATVANLACGFDVLGLAINKPGDELIMEPNRLRKVIIASVTGDGGKLSVDPGRNTAGVAIQALLKSLKSKQGFTIRLNKKMPLGSGLGSSAASAAGAVFACNQLLGCPFTLDNLITFAMEGERVACGSAHADNVAPALLGGITLIRSVNPLEVISLPVPQKLFIVVVHPHLVVMTKKSRAAIKKHIPLKTVVSQTGSIASFVTALFTSDYDLLGRSMIDFIAEPFRARLITGYSEARELALKNGAIACSISGSGPSVFGFCMSSEQAHAAGTAIAKGFEKYRVKTDIYVSKINKTGVKIID